MCTWKFISNSIIFSILHFSHFLFSSHHNCMKNNNKKNLIFFFLHASEKNTKKNLWKFHYFFSVRFSFIFLFILLLLNCELFFIAKQLTPIHAHFFYIMINMVYYDTHIKKWWKCGIGHFSYNLQIARIIDRFNELFKTGGNTHAFPEFYKIK